MRFTTTGGSQDAMLVAAFGCCEDSEQNEEGEMIPLVISQKRGTPLSCRHPWVVSVCRSRWISPLGTCVPTRRILQRASSNGAAYTCLSLDGVFALPIKRHV